MVKKTIEETYQKLTQREHVLKRPGMYVGSADPHNEEMWVYNFEKQKIEKKMVTYTPAFIKIFDEILTNATDHATRDSTVTTIKVDFNKETGEITVFNNGSGVPVEHHKEHNIYVPELIFGNMLSGSNYNDNDDRTGAGTNGVGSTCANIYSTTFTVETLDSNNKLKFVQTYSNNMSEKTVAKVTKNSGKSYTKITFTPDYARFKMSGLDNESCSLLAKRVIDCIACTDKHVAIYLNGDKLKGKGLQDYTKYFFDENVKVFYDTNNDSKYTWEWAIIPNEQFEHVSFVNGNNTYIGGKHLDHLVTYQIVNKLKAMIESKKKIKDLKPSYIKDKLFVFLRATIKNPSFSSQTKEQLTTQVKDFGCRIDVSDAFIQKLYKSSIVEEIVELCKLKEARDLSKTTDGKKSNKIYIPKLEDALWAGTAKSKQCTLMLTEGDSAKTFAMWGRTVINKGVETMGVSPLKGKCVSEDTQIPLWNGEIKLAKDVKIGDVLIGDDGMPRNVITLYNDNGKMYEISQDRGMSYKVNEDHLLTLCIPEHKKIHWSNACYAWKALYWDKNVKQIRYKQVNVFKQLKCDICDEIMSPNYMQKHYKIKHKDIKLEKKNIDVDFNDKLVQEGRVKLESILKTIDDNNIIDISILDYLNVSKSVKRKIKGLRGDYVKWPEQEIKLDPYVLGLWLGDGSQSGYSYSCYSEKDPEIMDYLMKWGEQNDATFKKTGSRKYQYSISSTTNFRVKNCSPLKKILTHYNLINNKHIPKEYLINSQKNRLNLLAGLIDTDGYVANDGTIEISQCVGHHDQLAKDIIYLSRSLGFYTYVTKKKASYTYNDQKKYSYAHRIKISGDIEKIPTRLPRKRTKNTQQYIMRNLTGIINIKEIPNENFVGIGTDGNHRFVINDFTVTHNCLNIRDASISQLTNNEEINNLKQILGLKQGKVYTDTSELRYGKLMLLTDADSDGSHIKSLIVNMFHCWWPSLLKLNFIQTLRTPIVVATKGKSKQEFYTEQDYKKWQETVNMNTWNVKYYKGLGTSRKEDAQSIFSRFEPLKIDYYYKDDKCDEAILLAFEKDKNKNTSNDNQSVTTDSMKMTDQRKRWLQNYDKNVYINAKTNSVSYQDLINKELIHFSIYDNMRSIPNMIDGLKPSQRKIMYYMLQNGSVSKEIKVAQLSGYVSAETNYHHGEASLQQAIINLAQNFVGSNNLNYLAPMGNFGSRFASNDSASPRYIFTKLEKYTLNIFDKRDSPLLDYVVDDGDTVEPEFFVPVLPTVLLNGVSGIGTGYSTFIPQHKPMDIINNIYRILDNNEPVEMMPHYKGFSGKIEKVENEAGKYLIRGRYRRIGDTKIIIDEIPIGSWITQYKEFLESMIDGYASTSVSKKNDKPKDVKKKNIALKDVINKTKDENSGIHFEVEFKNKEDLNKLIENGTLEKELKLTKSISVNNMYLFDDSNTPVKYSSTKDILLDFCDIRLDYYQRRKTFILKQLKQELDILNGKMKFIKEYISGELEINRRAKTDIFEDLEKRGYYKYDGTYEYLVNMTIGSLTKERIDDLQNVINNKITLFKEIKAKTPTMLWRDDLDMLVKII